MHPVSSSSVRKTTPFAVPGRWRVMTMPGDEDVRMKALFVGPYSAMARWRLRERWHQATPPCDREAA